MLLAIQLKDVINYPVPASRVCNLKKLKSFFLSIIHSDRVFQNVSDSGGFDCGLMPGNILL